MDDLRQALRQCRQRIERQRDLGPLNEQNTKATLIEPLLRALGWDVEDIEVVQREYRPRSADRPVDYALLVRRVPRLFLEAKSLNSDLSDRRWAVQIMGYATVAGIEWVVLTNGDEYRVYNAHASVPMDEKHFRTIRISEGQSEAAETLGLLTRDGLEQDRIDVVWQAHFVDRQLLSTVSNLFEPEPDPSLVRLLKRRLPSLSPREIEEGLQRARVRIDFPLVNHTELVSAMGGEKTRPARDKTTGSTPRVTVSDLIAAGIVNAPLELHCTYKGQRLEATIRPNGTAVFDGAEYSSPSTAAGMARRSVVGSPPGRKYPQTNGWTFWRFTDAAGAEHTIDDLRQRYIKRHSR